MSAVLVALVAILALVAVITALLWSSRVGRRRDETPEDRYRREASDLHSPRNRRVERAKRRRKTWAAGSAGAAGTYYGSGSSCGGGSNCGGGSCGGGGGCGGGGN